MVLVVLFFVLSFFAIGGTYLNIDPYDNFVWIKTIIHFAFLVSTTTAIPFCYKKFSKKYDIKTGRKLCAWNCLIVLGLYFIIDIIIMGGIFDETFQNLGANSVHALMFWYINRKLFFNQKEVTVKTVPCKSDEELIENTQKTYDLDIDNMSPEEAAKYLFSEQLGEEYTPMERQNAPVNTKTKYCSKCGFLIDNETKKCTGCGKQYFRGIRFTKFSITVIALVSVIAVVSILCIVQYTDIQALKDEIDAKQSTINRLISDSNDNWDRLNFYDNAVVVIGDDGTEIYHKYGCSKLDISNGYWILNEEAADYDGYKRCSKCND